MENKKGYNLAIIWIVFKIRWIQLAISVRYWDTLIFIEITADVKIPSAHKTHPHQLCLNIHCLQKQFHLLHFLPF